MLLYYHNGLIILYFSNTLVKLGVWITNLDEILAMM